MSLSSRYRVYRDLFQTISLDFDKVYYAIVLLKILTMKETRYLHY